MRQPFALAEGSDDQLVGWRMGDGPPVLLLHGGPGLSFAYLDAMAEDIGEGYELASYQQRGLAPSATACPIDVAQQVEDVRRVLDYLRWPRAWVVGHSWGGHLLLHFAVAHQDRLWGGLAVDPLGGVADGGLATFDAELWNRATEDARTKAEAINGIAGGDAAMRETLSLIWPSYFAIPTQAPPMADIAVSARAYGTLMESINQELPRLEAQLGTITVPFAFLAGARSPMPIDESSGLTAERIPAAWLDVVDFAGHFPWHEEPGCVRAALDRLVGYQPRAQISGPTPTSGHKVVSADLESDDKGARS